MDKQHVLCCQYIIILISLKEDMCFANKYANKNIIYNFYV